MSRRNTNDYYPTPPPVLDALFARWRPTATVVWDPCAGDGRIGDRLRPMGFQMVESDIAQGVDFFAAERAAGLCLVTNPPFKRIRDFIDHAFAVGVKEMALICPERLWACGLGREQLERHPPDLWVNLDFRVDYLGKGGSPDRALAFAIWRRFQEGRTTAYEVWGRS